MRSYRPRALWKVIVGDILLGALALGLVAFFQLGLPILRAKTRTPAREPAQTPLPAVSAAPAAETAAPAPEASPAEADPAEAAQPTQPEQEQAEPTPEPTPDPRTEWQIRFAEHFTDRVVIGEGENKSVYHVADIYVASLDNFRTYTANNELAYWSTQDAMEMDADSHAILSISGDFYSYQPRGFLVRNGVLYMDDQTQCDLCVLYNSGVMACYGRDDYTVEDIWSRGVAQAWNFGPSLLDENGKAYPSYNVSLAVSYPNPRSAVGYYEPNLDGGGSALMTFLHQRYSRQSNGAGRELGDTLIITEEGWEEKR